MIALKWYIKSNDINGAGRATVLFVITLLILSGMLLSLLIKYRRLKSDCLKKSEEISTLKAEHDLIMGEVNELSEESIPQDSIDSITGLPNRTVFEDRLALAILNNQRQKSLFAVMSLTIDNLEDFEDLSVEDHNQLLRDFTRRLQMSVRQVDTISRFANCYFLFLLPYLSKPETAIYVAQRIQDNLLLSFKINKQDINLHVSMGISVYPIDGQDVDVLLKHADTAMRLAKQKGKNQYQFSQPELHHLGQRELNIVNLIRSDQLCDLLSVQYKYFSNPENARANKIVYVQATPHINHPEIGKIPFSELQPLAENSGRMTEVQEWLLEKISLQMDKWHAERMKPDYIAISTSLRQLENHHLIYKIIDVKNSERFKSSQFVLEISDDHAVQNPAYLEKLFTMLDESNIQISVGIVTLARFSRNKIGKIPLSYLKIDSQLVKDAALNQEKEDIIFKIIELAKLENIMIVAEGVESNNQRTKLQNMGCNLIEDELIGG